MTPMGFKISEEKWGPMLVRFNEIFRVYFDATLYYHVKRSLDLKETLLFDIMSTDSTNYTYFNDGESYD